MSQAILTPEERLASGTSAALGDTLVEVLKG